MHNVLISISIPFWLWTENSWNNRFSVQICTYFLDAITTVNQLLVQPLFSRGCYLKILTVWEPCLLRFACCCWVLLNAENLLDLLWWRLWWRRRGAGNFCDCQGDWSACAPRSCCCRSWAHSLSVESDWPSSQTFHSSDRRHRGVTLLLSKRSMTLRVWGSNRRGKRPRGPPTKPQQWDENECREMRDTDSFLPWARAVCPQWKNADQCVNCALCDAH